MVATFWGAFTVGRLLSIAGSSFISSSRYVLASIIAGILFTMSLLILSPHGVALWLFAAALGLSMSAVFPQGFAFITTALRLSGRQIAWLLISGSFGGMLLPWLTGLMLETISPHIVPAVTSVSMSLALISFLKARSATKSDLENVSL